MVSPTLRGRTEALDVMRGFAVLGILIANIPSFASPDFGGMMAHTKSAGFDLWLETLATILVEGKMRSLLAILFGVGVWLQYRKRSQVEGNWPGGYLRRSLCLAMIGLAHGILLWFGDILFFYAGMGVVTALLVKVDERILKAIIGIGYALGLLIGVGSVLLFSALPTESDPYITSLGATFVSGTYGDQLRARLILYPIVNLFLAVQSVAMVPLFLVGVLFGRRGILAAPSQNPKLRNMALGIGFGVGIPLNLLGLLVLKGNSSISLLMELSGGPVMAVGILMLGAMIVEKGAWAALTKPLAKVGRVALSVYLSQSVLASVLFYSWGFGLVGRVSLAQQLGIVVGIWAVNILFAHVWLRRFAMGPVEWLLRSVTERRRLSNRIETAST